MKALISPIESVHGGYRIAQIEENEFEVALPLFWIDCDDTVNAAINWYDPIDQTIKLNPQDITEE